MTKLDKEREALTVAHREVITWERRMLELNPKDTLERVIWVLRNYGFAKHEERKAEAAYWEASDRK